LFFDFSFFGACFVFTTISVIFLKPFFPFGYCDFCCDWFADELMKGVMGVAPKAYNL
jgi:hypothetical protein